MNKIKYFLVFIICNSMYSQEYFEGLITYSINYESKLTHVSSDQFNKLMGTKQYYAIKEGNYKSVFNGSFVKLQIYRSDVNRNYSLTAKSDTLYYENYSKNKDKALSFEIKKNQDTIMGIPCDLIIVKTEKSTTLFYFNSDYKVNPKLFKGHNYGNWYYTISKTRAMPLKIVTETKQFIMTSIAIEITPMNLNDNVFEIQDKERTAKVYW